MIIAHRGTFTDPTNCEIWIASALDRAGCFTRRIERTDEFDPDLHARLCRGADVALFHKATEITHDQFSSFRDLYKGKIVFWTFDWTDWEGFKSWYDPIKEYADFLFQTDGFHDGRLSKKGKPWRLMQAIDPTVHCPMDGITMREIEAFSCDVAFAGSVYTHRRRELMLELLGRDFKHWGKPSTEVWGRSFRAMCFASRIVVGDNFTNDVEGYWSDRVYLTLGCGGFFMPSYVQGLEYEFINHWDVVWWRSWEELQELIDWYLPREQHRKRIALNGMVKVHSEHTYDHRIKRFLGIVG